MYFYAIYLLGIVNKFLVTLVSVVTLITLITILAFTPNAPEETIKSNHTISRVSLNEFNITTTIAGMEDADIALIRYVIPDQHIYKESEDNSFFSDRDNKFVKFFIMEVPNEGDVTIHLGITVDDPKSSVEFPVELEYSSNGQKQSATLSTIKLEMTEELAETAIDRSTLANPRTMIDSETTYTDDIDGITEESPKKDPFKLGKYSIQILALSEFSEIKLNEFCDLYDLSIDETSKEEADGLTKVRYGLFESEIAARDIQQQLISKNLEGVFLVEVPN